MSANTAVVIRYDSQIKVDFRNLSTLAFARNLIKNISFSHYRVVRNTRNPVYEEDFTFYGLTMNELQSMSLHFVVLSFDRYSRDDVIGEVVCPFNTIELHQIENQQVALSREIQPRSLKVKFQHRKRLKASQTFKLSIIRSSRKDGGNFSSRYVGNQLLLD